MQTVIKVKVSELYTDFLAAIKTLFRREQEVEITISATNDFGLTKPETKEEYLNRLNRAIENIEKGKVVVFSPEELDNLNEQLISEK